MSDHRPSDEGWLDQPKNVDRIAYTLYAVCALVAGLDLVIDRHEYLGFAEWLGFYSWYGFVACVGLVLVAKGLRRILMRPEDYYDEDGEQR